MVRERARMSDIIVGFVGLSGTPVKHTNKYLSFWITISLAILRYWKHTYRSKIWQNLIYKNKLEHFTVMDTGTINLQAF